MGFSADTNSGQENVRPVRMFAFAINILFQTFLGLR